VGKELEQTRSKLLYDLNTRRSRLRARSIIQTAHLIVFTGLLFLQEASKKFTRWY